MSTLSTALISLSSLLALTAILVTVYMPRDVELYRAWRTFMIISFLATVVFFVVTIIDSGWWTAPTLLFGVATWFASNGVIQVDAARQWVLAEQRSLDDF